MALKVVESSWLPRSGGSEAAASRVIMPRPPYSGPFGGHQLSVSRAARVVG